MLRSAGDRTPKPRVVRLGSREVITEGLQPGDMVVTDGHYRIETGSTVEVLAKAAGSPG